MIVPVAAVAETVATSAASFKTIALADDVPENVCVPVKVCAVLVVAMFALYACTSVPIARPRNDLAPEPPAPNVVRSAS